MKAINKNRSIRITFKEEEVIVFFEWLHNLIKEERPDLFQDQAEERILFNLESELETVISTIFSVNYQETLLKARQKIRDIE